jgi:hypothetical protein
MQIDMIGLALWNAISRHSFSVAVYDKDLGKVEALKQE